MGDFGRSHVIMIPAAGKRKESISLIMLYHYKKGEVLELVNVSTLPDHPLFLARDANIPFVFTAGEIAHLEAEGVLKEVDDQGQGRPQ